VNSSHIYCIVNQYNIDRYLEVKAMKYASSIKFRGQLVEAIACDYDDYKRLGLLCPVCKDPVYLRKDSARVQGDRTVTIPACFCHFPSTDPELAKACENRVAGYTQEEVEKARAIARNQRLKLLQRWFWDIVSRYFIEGVRNNVKAEIEASELFVPIVQAQSNETCPAPDEHWAVTEKKSIYMKAAKHLGGKFADEIWGGSLESLIDFFVDGWSKGNIPMIKGQHTANISLSSADFGFLGRIKPSRFDWEMQKLICKEVMSFLCAKRQRQMLQTLVACEMGEATLKAKEGAWIAGVNIDRDGVGTITAEGWASLTKFARANITQLICAIPWADEFERIGEPTTKTAGKKTRYYLHGDRHEVKPKQYYCAACDLFAPLEHFYKTGDCHCKDHYQRYLKSQDTWKTVYASNPNYYRPKGAVSHFA
jgi:hypothetical protein